MLRETISVEINVEVEKTEQMTPPQQSILAYARPHMESATSSIIGPPIMMNNFELKPKSDGSTNVLV